MSGDNYFVQVVNDDYTLGQLIGPGSFKEAVEQIKKYVAERGVNPEETIEEIHKEIEESGYYCWLHGGSVSVVMADPMSSGLTVEPSCDNEDEVEVGSGAICWDDDDGTIRYIDNHGNCENIWKPGDADYEETKKAYFPNHVFYTKIEGEIEEDADEN